MSDNLDTQRVVNQFREWFDTTRDELQHVPDDWLSADTERDQPAVGLYELVEQFTALRHEVKLQTKAARKLQEQTDTASDALREAARQLATREPDRQQDATVARPLAESLIEVDEALRRGRDALEAARRRIIETSAAELAELRERLDALFARQPWWRRRLCRPWHQAVADLYFPRGIESQQEALASLAQGYELIQKRVARALAEHQIERMQCVGEMTDPNCMSIVDVVDDPYRPAGMVVEELRPGYLWSGKVLRFAEVRAVRQR